MIENHRTFKIITLGCKVNQYESAYLDERLTGAGWNQVSKGGRADITVINTCIVTRRASYQSRQAIRKAIRENPSGITVAIGCYAQVFPDDLSKIEGIGMITGNTGKGRLPDILLKCMESRPSCIQSEDFKRGESFEHLAISRFSNRTRAFLKIQDGCESFCTYCIVPFARGPLRSLDPSQVIESLQSLCTNNYGEVVLTGVHLGRYGADLERRIDLKGLLREIGKEGLPLRIRLSSLEPNEIDQDLIEMVASEEWLCSHFHVPMQSGDDRILEKMNRHYTSKEFEEVIGRIHISMPLAAIGVDVMAGFPGEGDNAYHNSFSMINNLPVSYLHVFPFSSREGTAAAGFPDQVDQRLIKKRARELRRLGQSKREAFYRSCQGKEFSVLTEGWHSEGDGEIKGLSDNYLPVIFQSDRLIKNKILKVRIEDVGKGAVIGKPLSLSL